MQTFLLLLMQLYRCSNGTSDASPACRMLPAAGISPNLPSERLCDHSVLCRMLLHAGTLHNSDRCRLQLTRQ
jgi:hypothetical protein